MERASEVVFEAVVHALRAVPGAEFRRVDVCHRCGYLELAGIVGDGIILLGLKPPLETE